MGQKGYRDTMVFWTTEYGVNFHNPQAKHSNIHRQLITTHVTYML